MKLVKAAGAIVLGFYMCNAGVSASAVDMIQEEVQVAIEGRVIDRDAEVVKATGKREGERGELPAGRALKSPKSPKSCKASKSSKSFPGQWNAANEEVYEALQGSNDVNNVDFTDDSSSTAVITLGFDLNWFGDTFSNLCLYVRSNGFIDIRKSCNIGGGNPVFGVIYFVKADLEPESGKYLVKSSTSSLKISFEDVKWTGGVGNIQAQIELFPNGDVLICYGEGDIPEEKDFDARVGDYFAGNYYIPDLPFNEDGNTSVWPECKCWKFLMPQAP